MEITSQLANIEDEVKLLKGEIKSVLKEIRAAVLNNDNPFTGNAASLRPSAAAPAPSPEASATPPEAPPSQSQAAAAPLPSPTPAPAAHGPPEAPAATAQAALSIEAPSLLRAPEPVPLRSEQPAHQEPADAGTDLLTIASLLSWAEDAIASLGTRRFRLMLELAYAAELLSPEVRDVLRDVAELWQTDHEPERSASVNECLLQLRQLEAILNGERVTRIPRRRLRRRGT
jgi:hypothetical protein